MKNSIGRPTLKQPKLHDMQRQLEASHGAFAAILDNGGVAARMEICTEILHGDLDPAGRLAHLEDITVPPHPTISIMSYSSTAPR